MPSDDERATVMPLVDLPTAPMVTRLTAVEATGGPVLSAAKRVWLYSADEWEDLIYAWARLMDGYDQVKRIGGANDRGIDIAAMRTSAGLSGDWDCFQCKHYNRAIQPADLWPEILKVFRNARLGYYKMPQSWSLLAPKGCGPSVDQYLSNPDGLRSAFLAYLADPSHLPTNLGSAESDQIRASASDSDFSLFRAIQTEDMLRSMEGTPEYLTRFGGQLPQREIPDEPPGIPSAAEVRYVEQLMGVYSEHFGGDFASHEDAFGHQQAAEHFTRQRKDFYSAEALRGYSRDCVPPGTFESLQDEIFEVVVEVACQSHSDGWDRLAKVLIASSQVQIQANPLLTVSYVQDRKGICHQLANEDRLTWCPKNLS